MNKRTMVTIIKTLTEMSYQEAMKELLALEDSRATCTRFGTGWRIGYMGFAEAKQQPQAVPVHQPATVVVETEEGFGFQAATAAAPTTRGSLFDFL